MDFSNYTLDQMYHVHFGAKARHEDCMERLSKDNNGFLDEQLGKDEFEARTFLEQVKAIYKIKQATDIGISLEWLMLNFSAGQKTLNIWFHPTSLLYEVCGDYITCMIDNKKFSQQELEVIFTNIKNKVDTKGKVYVKCLLNDQLIPEVKADIEKNGFNTSEIYKVEY